MRDINTFPGVTLLSTYYVPTKRKLNTVVFFISMVLFSILITLFTLKSDTNLIEFSVVYIIMLVAEILFSFMLARLTGKVLAVRTEYIVQVDNEEAMSELLKYYDVVESVDDTHIVIER